MRILGFPATRWIALCVLTVVSFTLATRAADDPAKPQAASDKQKDASPADQEPTAKEPSDKQPAAKKPSGKRHTNRLAKETSPYLLLHAHNPVNWYPWGEEALAKAKKENKLIFLSIGYSSCYWCHVMERESFMDEEIAAYMNEHFVCIKVDREERPDIDEIYMTALQAMTRRGGWPMSMFLTADGKPVIGGTYYPPRSANNMVGFDQVLRAVNKTWTEQPDAVRLRAEQIAKHLRDGLQRRPVVLAKLDSDVLDTLQKELEEEFDSKHGGFGFSEKQPRRPKFPEPANLVFLLDRVKRNPDDKQARRMLVFTLEQMASGGIRDHLAGGFHRYSTDRFWRVPHFEKMLYDNGQLMSVYAEAFALTGRKDFAQTAQEIGDFVLSEMTGEGGGFYSALDAETDAEEGKFYIWTAEELKKNLNNDEFLLLTQVYGVGGGPNFESHYILLLNQPFPEIAGNLNQSQDELRQALVPIRKKLLNARSQRKRPLTDTKVLASWNGLMIAGLADAGRILNNDRFVKAAARAADFVLEKLRTEDGRLKRTYGAGQAKLNAYLDDYAFLAHGLIALYEATGEKRWLNAADQFTAKQIELFWDQEGGGFFFTSHDHETLILRSKDPADGAIPAGNSVAALNLLRLAAVLDRPKYVELAEQTIRTDIPFFQRAPKAVPQMAVALAELLDRQESKKGN